MNTKPERQPAVPLHARADGRPAAPLRHIQSLERGIRLLQAVARAREPLTGVEAADRARIKRSTAWRLLATLERDGMVERDASGRYAVGLELFTIATAAHWGAVARRGRPILEALSASTGESAALAVMNGGGFEILDQVDAAHALSVRWVGTRLPLLCTSVGKLILASLPAEELDRYLRRPVDARTPRTLTDPADIRAELDDVRRTGIATSLGDYELGVNGISAAARDEHGGVVAFASVTGPEVRLSEPRVREIAPLVKAAAAQLEVVLGLEPSRREEEERC